MPYKTIEEANVKELDGCPLSLEQANAIAAMADAMKADGKVENPWAVATAQFKKGHEIKDGAWVKREAEPTGKSSELPEDPYYATIAKSVAPEQKLWAVVLEPYRVDAQGDWLEPPDIEKAAHAWLMKHQEIGLRHKGEHRRDVLEPVESFVAPVPFKMGEQDVPQGAWVMGVHVNDTEVWKAVESGELNGFSIQGWGKRTPRELQKGSSTSGNFAHAGRPGFVGGSVGHTPAEETKVKAPATHGTADADDPSYKRMMRAKKYGIKIKAKGRLAPPQGYEGLADTDFGDPVNYAFPIDQAHLAAQVARFNTAGVREDGGYDAKDWDTIGRRIAAAAGLSYANGKIVRGK
jgi:hypothetical protein